MNTSSRSLPDTIESEEELDELLSRPSSAVYRGLQELDGDLMILGVSGKMGPTLARMAVRALDDLNLPYHVYGVARFSRPAVQDQLQKWGVRTIPCDLLNASELANLPASRHIIFMAGQKFGTTHNRELTWAINTYAPALVAQRYKNASIVILSTGNVYPLVSVISGGSSEDDAPAPIGEYAASSLGRERIFEYFSRINGTRCAIMRLNYANEMRYGVLTDIARKVWSDRPITLEMGAFNAIWQGDANARALGLFAHCAAPPFTINVTGPETISVRYAAECFGHMFGKTPIFMGMESDNALLSNAAQSQHLFGYPTVSLDQMMIWIGHWTQQGGPLLGKPTHFEVRDGRF